MVEVSISPRRLHEVSGSFAAVSTESGTFLFALIISFFSALTFTCTSSLLFLFHTSFFFTSLSSFVFSSRLSSITPDCQLFPNVPSSTFFPPVSQNALLLSPHQLTATDVAPFSEKLCCQPFQVLVSCAAMTVVDTASTQKKSVPCICFHSPLADSYDVILSSSGQLLTPALKQHTLKLSTCSMLYKYCTICSVGLEDH